LGEKKKKKLESMEWERGKSTEKKILAFSKALCGQKRPEHWKRKGRGQSQSERGEKGNVLK